MKRLVSFGRRAVFGVLRRAQQALHQAVYAPPAHLRFAISDWRNGPTPRVLHSGTTSGIGGPTVKLNRMQRYFPNTPYGYNIIYSVSASTPPDVCRKAKKRGVKIVAHLNSLYHPAYRSDYAERNRAPKDVFAIADHVVYGSHFAIEGGEKYFGSMHPNHTIIYNAVDIDHYKPVEQTQPRPLTVLAIGVHYIRHRLEPLIRAWPILKATQPDAKLVIAGELVDGEGLFDCGQRSIEQLISDVGAKDIIFTGRYTQVDAPTLYTNSDVMVHLKHMDWTPNTAIEAMACGIPIVHNGNGGMNEICGNAAISLGLANNWDQVIVPEPEAVADAIIRAAAQRGTLGAAGRRLAIERYDMRQWAKTHHDIFKKLLSP